MKRILLLSVALASSFSAIGRTFAQYRNEGIETNGPDSSPYAKRARKGKGQRKAHRAGRWG